MNIFHRAQEAEKEEEGRRRKHDITTLQSKRKNDELFRYISALGSRLEEKLKTRNIKMEPLCGFFVWC